MRFTALARPVRWPIGRRSRATRRGRPRRRCRSRSSSWTSRKIRRWPPFLPTHPGRRDRRRWPSSRSSAWAGSSASSWYYLDEPRTLSRRGVAARGASIAAHVAFAVQRTRAEEQARRSEAHLRYVARRRRAGHLGLGPDHARRCSGRTISSGCTASRRRLRQHVRQLRAAHPSRRPRARDGLAAPRHRARHAARRRISRRRGRRHACAGSKARAASSTRRPARPHDRRLHDRHAAQGSRARAPGISGRGEPAEGRVPRHPVARAADAAQRHPRLGADAASRHAAGRPRAPGHRHHRPQCQGPGPARSRTSSTSRASSPASSRSSASACSSPS